MGITKCWNCERMIHTDASPTCPFCGVAAYEVKRHHCIINMLDYDFTNVYICLENIRNGRIWDKDAGVAIIKSYTGLDYENSKRLWRRIVSHSEVPKSYKPIAIEEIQAEEAAEKAKREEGIPRCPTCRSTNIQKLGVASRAIDGFVYGRHSVEGRAQFWCKNCNYRW